MKKSESDAIKALILRRRQQIWIHSIIYYRLATNLISDSKWSEWALELEKLQSDYPKLAARVKYHDIFKDFDHSTGQNLPLDDEDMTRKAEYLVNISEKYQSI